MSKEVANGNELPEIWFSGEWGTDPVVAYFDEQRRLQHDTSIYGAWALEAVAYMRDLIKPPEDTSTLHRVIREVNDDRPLALQADGSGMSGGDEPEVSYLLVKVDPLSGKRGEVMVSSLRTSYPGGALLPRDETEVQVSEPDRRKLHALLLWQQKYGLLLPWGAPDAE